MAETVHQFVRLTAGRVNLLTAHAVVMQDGGDLTALLVHVLVYFNIVKTLTIYS